MVRSVDKTTVFLGQSRERDFYVRRRFEDCLNFIFLCFSSTAAKVKNIRRGVKEVQKFINKGEKGWEKALGVIVQHYLHVFWPLNGPTVMAHGHLSSLCRIVVLAGDTLPIDVYCHLPVMCEDKNLPYAYIPSKVVSLWTYKPVFHVITECLIFLVRLTPVFGSACRTWGHRRGQRGQPVWSWSNLMRTIRVLTMSVWRRCPASPNLSETHPWRDHVCEGSKDELSLQVFSFRFPCLRLISNTSIRLWWSPNLSCRAMLSDRFRWHCKYVFFILYCNIDLLRLPSVIFQPSEYIS